MPVAGETVADLFRQIQALGRSVKSAAGREPVEGSGWARPCCSATSSRPARSAAVPWPTGWAEAEARTLINQLARLEADLLTTETSTISTSSADAYRKVSS